MGSVAPLHVTLPFCPWFNQSTPTTSSSAVLTLHPGTATGKVCWENRLSTKFYQQELVPISQQLRTFLKAPWDLTTSNSSLSGHFQCCWDSSVGLAATPWDAQEVAPETFTASKAGWWDSYLSLKSSISPVYIIFLLWNQFLSHLGIWDEVKAGAAVKHLESHWGSLTGLPGDQAQSAWAYQRQSLLD